MQPSIPASAIVNILPNVINAGGTGLDLSGLALTNSTRVPIGTVQVFTSQATVAAFFGLSSVEAAFATRYFAAYVGAPIRPAQLLFMQYAPTGGVPGYLRSASLATMTLDELNAITPGTVTLSINGSPVTSASIDLSAAGSFSAAAALIATAINHNDASFTGAISGVTLTVSALGAGALAVGQIVEGAGVTAGTKIVALGSGTGGTGTYTVSPSQTASSTTMTSGATTVAYDAVLSAFVISAGTPGAASSVGFAADGTVATALSLTAATGAVVSAGADASTPAGAMAAVVADTQNFASFTTLFLPSADDMVAFGAWTSAQNYRYFYALWDTDVNNTQPDPSTTATARIIAADYGGVLPIYTDISSPYLAAAAMGWIASIDFTRADGRVNLAFLAQDGLPPTVTNEGIAAQLELNGLNFYARYATANNGFTFFYPGSVTGSFLWADSMANEIWMTNQFQLTLMELLTQVHSIPYNSAGYALVEAALATPIQQAVAFGAIQAGVTLSSLQAAEINRAANADVAGTIEDIGWYLQVAPATPEVRAARGSPPITLWYTDGQSIQRINLNSVEVQ